MCGDMDIPHGVAAVTCATRRLLPICAKQHGLRAKCDNPIPDVCLPMFKSAREAGEGREKGPRIGAREIRSLLERHHVK